MAHRDGPPLRERGTPARGKTIDSYEQLAAPRTLTRIWAKFRYVDPRFIGLGARSGEIVDIQVSHRGIYPVYNTAIHVVDLAKLDEARKVPNGLDNFINQYESYRYVERLDPNRFEDFDKWQLPRDVDRQGYNIFFSSRNGDFVQSLRFRRINGEWMVSMQVTRLGGSQTFLEHGLEFLPRDKNGQPKW